MTENLNQLFWMLGESFILGACLYLLLRLRPWLGNTPLIITVGTFQFIQVALAISVYVEVFPGLLVSPGSSILFTGTVLSVLLVYIVDDAKGARRLIYSLLLANILLSLITFSVGSHMENESTLILVEIPLEIFKQNPRILLVGTVTLFLDTILIIVVYEFLNRVPTLFLRMTIALSGVLIFDSILFVTGSFFGSADYLNILYSSIIGKIMMVPPATLAVAILDKLMTESANKESHNISDFFNLLTYRQKYELAKNDSLVDPLTRLYNRRAFDSAFDNWIDIGTYAILMIDADKFKAVNDELGHTVGDKVIQLISSAITTQLRGSDIAYRYGGEEFMVFLPYTTVKEAVIIGERIRDSLNLKFKTHPLSDNRIVTISIGAAAAPDDGKIGHDIIKEADSRLYWAKNHGRDRVVGHRVNK